jgi:hypothetical protein
MTKIRTYKMTHDTGFAPNFDGGVLTLATCKPGIREKAEEGEWIAGFTSKRLNGDPVGQERLVYLGEVSKKLTFGKYWDLCLDKRPNKRPKDSSTRLEQYGRGDNIYANNPDGYEFDNMTLESKETYKKKYKKDAPFYVQVKNGDHGVQDMVRDLSSENVLICEKFMRFDVENPLDVEKFKQSIKVPKYPAPYGYVSEGDIVQEFIDYVFAQNTTPDISYTDSKVNSKSKSCSKK